MFVRAVAAQAEDCERTVHRQLAKPAFRGLVACYRNELIAAAIGRMADNMIRPPMPWPASGTRMTPPSASELLGPRSASAGGCATPSM